MKTVFWKTPYNHDTDQESQRTGLECKDPSKTLQSQAEDADINTIVRRFGLTGELPAHHQREARYVDLTDQQGDFLGLQVDLAQAKARFHELPPARRAEYLNNPNKWLEDVNEAIDQGDIQTLEALGVDIQVTPKGQNQGPPTAAPGPQTDTPEKVSVNTLTNK
ncbi:MAG: internal scaffolding protein [Microvirus sp.]|nr:MAG: internal scaffolding protein [Microvirus sp.]